MEFGLSRFPDTTMSPGRRKFLRASSLAALSAMIVGATFGKVASAARLARAYLWPPARALDDPYIELEQLNNAAVDAWVRAQTMRTMNAFGRKDEVNLHAVQPSAAREPDEYGFIACSRWGDWAYSSWTDVDHPLDFIIRTPWDAWVSGNPKWERVLDNDSLDLNRTALNDMRWSIVRYELLPPDGDRALVHLSRGGSDAHIVREFDVATRTFVENGFSLLEPGHHFIQWLDRDTVYVGSDAPTPQSRPLPARAETPRQIRRWPRGVPRMDAPVIFEAGLDDLSVSVSYDFDNQRHIALRYKTDSESEQFWLDESANEWRRYDVPRDLDLFTEWAGWLFLMPRSDWLTQETRYSSGTLLAIRRDELLSGSRRFSTLFLPTSSAVFTNIEFTKHWLIVAYKHEGITRTTLWKPPESTGETWTSEAYALPGDCTATIRAVDRSRDDTVLIQIESFLHPPTLYLADLSSDEPWQFIDAEAESFDPAEFVAQRRQAIARDGTLIPYWVIGNASALQGAPRPCLLTGYGGFGVTMDAPSYLGHAATDWLTPGGVYAIAGIRGGGEFGPAWHKAAQRQKRQIAFDDFIAVSEALINTGITTSKQLAIQGGSNGGLLTAVCMIQRPDLFGAVLCEVPVLDMLRFHLLLRGAMWLDEYGNPDHPADRRALLAYSPYHNVQPGASYPPALFTSSATDDRVHPGHARKMVAKMQAQGHDQVWYMEARDGGHGGIGVVPEDAVRVQAIKSEFLRQSVWDGIPADS